MNKVHDRTEPDGHPWTGELHGDRSRMGGSRISRAQCPDRRRVLFYTGIEQHGYRVSLAVPASPSGARNDAVAKVTHQSPPLSIAGGKLPSYAQVPPGHRHRERIAVPQYVHVGIVLITVPNLIVIVLMVVVFALAVALSLPQPSSAASGE